MSPRGLRTLVAEPYRGKLPWRYLVRFRPPLGPVDERLGFVTRIRRIRQIKTPLGFRTEQITNAYRVHEPSHGFGLLATLVFATESNCWTPSDHVVESLNGADALNRTNPLHHALERLSVLLKSKKGAAPSGAAKGYPM